MAIATSGIYVIRNRKTNNLYFGQAQDLRLRWRRHKTALNGKYHDNPHLQRAWAKYGAAAFEFKVLEYCDIDQLDEREQHYLDIYMPKGNCYNIAQDVRAAGRGRRISEETRQKMSESAKGKIRSEEHRLNLSKVNQGKKHSEASRQKMSEAAKKRVRKPLSADTRRKISEAQIGKTISEDSKRKMSEASKGRKHSEETRRKMSESHKSFRARQRAEAQLDSNRETD